MADNNLDPHHKYREQHKKRLSYMPWLYWKLKPNQKQWAQKWQNEYQEYLQDMEMVEIKGDCFISPLANLFAEPGRKIIIEEGSFIAADCVLHGPILIGKQVSINHHCTLEAGNQGIVIKDYCRLAAYCHLYSFNHGFENDRLIKDQPTTSQGIILEKDVWLGAHVGVVDGVKIGSGSIVGMQSVVTKNIDSNIVVAGNPAKKIKER
ncbi:acyltransferase [Marinicellulosiphila megalodicopiae]|uniref:acyltransferase n=1 Tax=Marinicellulosiphila megalodicopiae TaxID=2724896 RepID=UPI003BB03F05